MKSDIQNANDRPVKLGVISGAHGVKGQVKIRSFTSKPEDIISYGELADKSGDIYSLTVTGQSKDVLIVTIQGVTSRDEAEKLRNVELYVKRSTLPALAENEYYHEDLVGLEVFTEQNTLYGCIIAINNFGAGDIAEIKRISGEEEMQPFNKAIFPTIDVKNRKLVIAPAEMLE